MQSEHGDIIETWTKSGLRRYHVEIRHDGLHKFKVVRGDNVYVVKQKARSEMAHWDQLWAQRQAKEQKATRILGKKQQAEERTEEAIQDLISLENILTHTLTIDDIVDWESLKNKNDFPQPKPPTPLIPKEPKKTDPQYQQAKNNFPQPKPPIPLIPKEPKKTDPQYQIKLSLLDRIISSNRLAKEQQAKNEFISNYKQWKRHKKSIQSKYAKDVEKWAQERDAYLQQAENDFISDHNQWNRHKKSIQSKYAKDVEKWAQEGNAYLEERDATNKAIDAQRQDYLNGKDAQAIVDYCDIVLSNSEYPDYFPQSYELDYNPETKLLVIDYQLPPISEIPTLKEVKYIQSRDEFTEKHISQAQLNKMYDDLLYQIALRTLHEIYEADQINVILSIAFNGYVDSIDRATGQENNSCILSLQAGKEEFEQINLANIEPKACFKKLKGVSASKLSTLTPVAPLMKIDREDGRFVSSYNVADEIEGENLAAMDWEDFEHLIRELFEKEFSSTGGEVKVTRASRDGGIDAVVFDPDPLRGGKIVIQAKRYTNTVGVSAVRDLYGTLINEGANKGILVSTADYGPDAHEFAKGKPITLLNGSQLLELFLNN